MASDLSRAAKDQLETVLHHEIPDFAGVIFISMNDQGLVLRSFIDRPIPLDTFSAALQEYLRNEITKAENP